MKRFASAAGTAAMLHWAAFGMGIGGPAVFKAIAAVALLMALAFVTGAAFSAR